MSNATERLMAMFAKQGPNNVVTGIDVFGFVQRLILFDECIIASVWLKDVQLLLSMVDPGAFCDLLDTGALRFYIDSATTAEIGQARHDMNIMVRGKLPKRLDDHEFDFATLRGHNDADKVRNSLSEIARSEILSQSMARKVTERIEAALLEPKGLEVIAEACKGFYSELRNDESITLKEMISDKLRKLGQKPKGLHFKVEEFEREEFRVHSNLTTKFGLSSKTARKLSLDTMMELVSVYTTLSYMREFSCVLGTEERVQSAWDLKADSLIRSLAHESQNRTAQFARVAKIAGVGEDQLVQSGRIDLDRLLTLRQSDELASFRSWLRSAESKSDKDIRERVCSIRAKIGSALDSKTARAIRFLITQAPGAIPNPAVAMPLGMTVSALDSFFLERIAPRDAVFSVLLRDYPALLR